MNVPATDATYLADRGLTYQVSQENGMTCVVLVQWPLPPGFNCASSDLLLRLSAGYPDVQPDMWWFDPPIRLANGQELPATQVIERHLGRSWQRWSRHFNGGQWQSGVDGLESYLALIRRELERSASTGGA
ncbi:MAG TPA: E2/UBC family protein [Acidimicrobiales bacterium]|nr:E2/UBC family protein [Acidimicrobiales bacterium]